jgi:hypothetical protein
LKDDLHLGPQWLHLPWRIIGDVLAIEMNLSASGFVQFENRSTNGGFTATRFANESESLSLFNGKREAIDRLILTLNPRENTVIGNGEKLL